MNLYEQQPYWLIKNGIVASYPSLQKDLKLDVAIIGAGISAALTAWQLRNSGLSIAVFDKRHVGMGSTAASTAFLQYEIDTPLTSLKNLVGEANAVTSYQLCRKAIYDIADLCKSLKPAFDFSLRPSLQYASFKTHTAWLMQEYELRKKHGFDVHWLEADEIEQKFGFKASGGILFSLQMAGRLMHICLPMLYLQILPKPVIKYTAIPILKPLSIINKA